jgi:hypothetical protein
VIKSFCNPRARPSLSAAAVLALGCALGLSPVRAGTGPSIRLNPPDDRRAAFEVIGLEAAQLAALGRDEPGAGEWAARFAVFTVPAGEAGAPSPLPILGSYRVTEGVLRFQPRFPLEPGVRYRARFDPAKFAATSEAGSPPIVSVDFVLPKDPPTSPTRVIAVYPSRSVLPENLLRLYLHFSAPMSRGMAYEHVRLRDASGKVVAYPFVELAEELWDPRGERMTLLFDPGRLKTGLKPREELGPILRPGETYTLTVDRGWLDAEGEPLAADYQKTFRAGPTDEQPPDPSVWKVQPPRAGSRDALRITFPEPLDSAMLRRVIAVQDPDGKPVAGGITLAADETLWQFSPEATWRAGRYSLSIDKDLEDLVGNSIGRPFEVDVFEKIERQPVAELITIPFQVTAPPR